jgi:hypothetical protein
LRRWLRKAAKKGGPVDFESDVIPAPLYERLSGALQVATSAAEVRAVFSPFLTGKMEPFTPEPGPLLPVEKEPISEDDIDKAIAVWDKTFPELAGLLEAEAERG